MNAKGRVDEYMAHHVVKGYSQVEGVRFGDIFSPIEKLTSPLHFYYNLQQHLILK
jgi:hypothetical protein